MQPFAKLFNPIIGSRVLGDEDGVGFRRQSGHEGEVTATTAPARDRHMHDAPSSF